MRYEDEWAVAVLAGLLSAVVAGVAALRERVLQSVLDQRSDRKPVPLVVDAAVDLALTAAE
jgi:hypothetical protein